MFFQSRSSIIIQESAVCAARNFHVWNIDSAMFADGDFGRWN